ncbi:MAG TPA: hypothetical protein VFQ38_21365, partial [Longimicrobiales bacterium]|nr:hypothetical protein [Longimicrobiales bacterium]
MPSDERVGEALRALAAPREAFRSAVAAAAEQVRAFLAVHAAPAPSGPSRAAEELGVFAAGRVDAARFEALFSGAQVVDPAALALAERALEVLAGIAAASDAAYLAEVSPGGSLRAVVDAALARTGRAFAAGHLFERVRSGRHVPPGDDWGLHSYPPRLWNRAERQIAPPLVVEVDGADLQAGALAEFVQG